MVHSVFSRFLSVATVLTLLAFAASTGLQPATTLASPEVGPDRVDVVSYLDDDDNGNNGDDDDNNGNNGHNGHNGNNGDGGRERTFFPCAIPWFANNPGCALGLFGG